MRVSSSPPGWYPDPWHPGLQRFWDGLQWTVQRPGPVAPPPPPFPTMPFRVAIGALLSMAVPLVVSRILLRSLADRDWPIAVYLVIAALLAYGPPVVFWIWASKKWGRGRPALDVGLLMRPVDLAWGPVTWIACFVTQIIVGIVVVALRVPFQSNTDGIAGNGDDRGYVIAMLILAVVVAPLVEEVIFRGMVLRGFLTRWKPPLAIALQGVLFGLAHVAPERGVRNVGLVIVLSSVGAVLGVSAYLARRLAPTIIGHAMLNALAMVIVLSGWTAASDGAAVQQRVVDQAHVAEPHRGHRDGVLVGAVDPGEGATVHQLEVLEPGERLGGHDRSSGVHQRAGIALALRVPVAQRVE